MTDEEKKTARALQSCSMHPRSNEKRFVTNMVAIANGKPKLFLSDGQRAYLNGLAWRYRKQLKRNGHADVVPAEDPNLKKL